MSDTTPILSLKNVSVNYGGIRALDNISFDVPRGKIATLIGANGAGKTTTLKAISRLLPLSSGTIHFNGRNITDMPAHKVVALGVAHAPEGRGIFLNLSVEENLDLGAWAARDKTGFQSNLSRVFELFPRLAERRRQNAGTLSGGEQQMLAIGRALMADPELLLLDEPSLGLAPQIIEKIFEIIIQINKSGKTVLLVEQNALIALKTASIGIILENGRISTQGGASDLLNSDEIRKAYLGG